MTMNANTKIVVEDATADITTPSEFALENEDNLTQMLMLVCSSPHEAVELCALVAMTVSVHQPGGMANVQKLHDLIDRMSGYVQVEHADCIAEVGGSH